MLRFKKHKCHCQHMMNNDRLTTCLFYFLTSRIYIKLTVATILNSVFYIRDFCDDFFETLHHDILGIEGASPPWALNMCCSLYPVLRRPQLEVVGGSHAHTVGTCVMNNQSSSLKGQYMSEGNRGDTNHQIKYNGFEKDLIRRWKFPIFSKEICGLTNWSNNIEGRYFGTRSGGRDQFDMLPHE